MLLFAANNMRWVREVLGEGEHQKFPHLGYGVKRSAKKTERGAQKKETS